MAKVKKGKQRITASVSYNEVNTGREYTPFIKRTEQQQVRTGEFIGSKSKIVRAAPVASGASGSVGANGRALINLTLTAHDANVILAWPQINIYVDTDNTLDSLWFKGDDIGASAEALLSLGWVQLINTSSASGLASNQAQMQGIFINRDSSAHTYYIHVRWLYMIVE